MSNNIHKGYTTEQSTEDNNILLQDILNSFSNIDISDPAHALLNRLVELFKTEVKQLKKETLESELQLNSRIIQLTAEVSALQQRLCEAGRSNIELQLSLRQLREEKSELGSKQAILEQERVVLSAKLAEYRETLQELAGYEFLRLRFD